MKIQNFNKLPLFLIQSKARGKYLNTKHLITVIIYNQTNMLILSHHHLEHCDQTLWLKYVGFFLFVCLFYVNTSFIFLFIYLFYFKDVVF